MKKFFLFVVSLFFIIHFCVFAQSYTSVSLDDHIYKILEQAEMRGLCRPLPGAKPYTRSVIVSAINEILSAENKGRGLHPTERSVLEYYRDALGSPDVGLDLKNASYYNEAKVGRTQAPLSAYIGAGIDAELADGVYWPAAANYVGTDFWVNVFIKGDIGKHFSYDFNASGGLVKVPRTLIGEYNTYYDGFEKDEEYKNAVINTYSRPLTHFPYTYQKKWDGSTYLLRDVYGFDSWPSDLSGAYNLKSEIGGMFLDNAIKWRLGRLEREWGNSAFGSSLALNSQARPFLGIEGSFTPFDWFGFSALTGILEYYNEKGIKESAWTNQNAFATSMLEFKYKNYFYFDLGESVIWTKRYELGYLSPFTNHIFYQNNIGDFDNVSMFINLKGQYPGLGKVWVSLFWDEAFWVKNAFESDGTMIAVQAGTTISLPVLAFSSVKISYTKVEPYCYTHNRNLVPGYTSPMETAYTNNGVGLGYYTPPNSDELLMRLETMPVPSLVTSFQYQMIRHGADFGPGAVDGSSYRSELDPDGRGEKPVSKKFFLHDGAYEWLHVLKAGVEKTFTKVPLRLYGEAGVVFSYFTNIDGDANQGYSSPYHIVDEAPYAKGTNVIVTVGVKIFPHF